MLDRLKQAGTDVAVVLGVVLLLLLVLGYQFELDINHLHIHARGWNSYQ